MLFVSAEDFYEKARRTRVPTDEETRELGARIRAGDPAAREALFEGYLPFIASLVNRHFTKGPVSLNFIYRCVEALENGVDRFDFSQGKDAFLSYLSIKCKQEITRYIAEEGGR